MAPPVMERSLEFVIVGAQKAGTTSLHRYLAAHPGIFLPEEKELDFFGTAERFERGPRLLDRHFREARPEHVLGLSYVGMMFLPGAAQRVQAYRPAMKIVAVLRNPVERAYSAYWYHRRTGWERSATFEEALARETEPSGADPVTAAMSYRRNGCYVEQLRPYLERFGPDRVRLLLTEELRDAPGRVVGEIAAWLGAGPAATPPAAGRRHNVAAMPRLAGLHRMLMARDSRAKRVYHALVPAPLRRLVRRQVTLRALRLNERPFRYPDMSPSTRRELAAFYAPHNERLARWLGRDLSHWT